tara:strand:- start:4335 stop:6785 length:2451 start_codon:yes stop_codon:yes gene_type:complete
MLIRSTLELAQASKVNICIAKIPGYSHTEAFRELSERIEAECMRQKIPCSISNNWQIKADTNFVLGAHLEPEKYKNLDIDRTILFNLERLASLQRNETTKKYIELLQQYRYIDFSSENSEYCSQKSLHQPIYLYRPWHEKAWARTQNEIDKEWDACLIGSITPRRQKLAEALNNEGIKTICAFNCYASERDEILSKSQIALNVHAYEDSKAAEILRLAYYISNNLNIVSENSTFETGEERVSLNLEQYAYEDLIDGVKKKLKSIKNIKLNNAKKKEIAEAALNCHGENHKASIKKTDVFRPTTLNIGCGLDWNQDAINIDIEKTGVEDITLDISASWDQISKFYETKRFGMIYLGEKSFDIIKASCVLEHVKDLTNTLRNISKLLKPGGWLYLRYPHQDSLGAWQDPTHVRGMNEHLMKYLYEWSDYINLENSKLKPKWISFVQEDSTSKINKRDKERIGFIEAVLIKEESVSRGKINAQQIDDLISARTSTGAANLRETIHRRTYIETSRAKDKNADNNSEITPTVSLLTPTYGKRFKYLSAASRWISQQDYPLEKVEWNILTDTQEESDYLKERLAGQDIKPIYDIKIFSSDEKLPIGAKRNLIHQFADGEVFINIDDDDYYMPNRISHAIDRLLTSDADYAGCRYLPIYFVNDQSMWISDPGENVACAGSFAYKKSLLKKTWYPPTSTNGEELGFTNNFTLKKVDLDAFSTMICIAHEENTFDKRNLREGLSDGEDSSFFAGKKRIKGDRGFFEASRYKKDNQLKDSEWRRIYDLLSDKNASKYSEEENFFYVTNLSSRMDKLASFVIDRLSK